MRDLVSPDLDLIKQAEQEAGWSRYEKGDRTPRPNPKVARIIKERAAEMGVEQRSFSDEEILRRLLFASVNGLMRS